MRSMISCSIAVLALTCYSVQGQDLDSLMNLNAFTEESDLQKMLNKNVSVSSQNLSTRETPGIISVVTAEEIQNSGARDMIDVLRLVPGFDVAQDLQFVMGLSLRGNWANEGKVLVLMDGQPFNELLYQSVAVGNRFPDDAIERIEIIRGPGSAQYGGSAEYGVINIITKAASSLTGVGVYGTAGCIKRYRTDQRRRHGRSEWKGSLLGFLVVQGKRNCQRPALSGRFPIGGSRKPV